MFLFLILVIISANIGGAPSPIGDVTTLMPWLENKFTATQVLARGLPACIAGWFVSTLIISLQIKSDSADSDEDEPFVLTKSEGFMICLIFSSCLLPVIAVAYLHLPAYIGLVASCGIVGFAAEVFKRFLPEHETHVSLELKHLVSKTEMQEMFFFIGLLLCVSGLNATGVLNQGMNYIFGSNPSENNFVLGIIGLGILSAFLDNIALMALALLVLNTYNSSNWILLALSTGIGGSMTHIGSAASVIVWAKAQALYKNGDININPSPIKYLQYATVPALASFAVTMLVAYLQNLWLIK